MSESLAVLQEQYLTLKKSLPGLLDAAQDKEQRKALRAQYRKARKNYHEVQNKILTESGPKVREAAAAARANQKKMEEALQNLQDVAKALDVIAGAVSAGAHLVSMLSGAAPK